MGINIVRADGEIVVWKTWMEDRRYRSNTEEENHIEDYRTGMPSFFSLCKAEEYIFKDKRFRLTQSDEFLPI